ncbi:pyridoxal phosphate-dependent decarboxylase family protein [Roseovarius nitratireducens]|uniref:pyridoxal phosphate-dependent decarboxylase family protein n=1 Tax=Roseovarius nitratireducens TaxID=2044597 RepID=UPI000CE1BED7|nr:pyridoxal-dependent decarboxylase [Roseovarius nitratireducens]
MTTQDLLTDAQNRAFNYISEAPNRRVFPTDRALDDLAALDEHLPEAGTDAADTLALLDRIGSPATVVSNGPNYYGFVVGGTLPVAQAADWLTSAWDQSATVPLAAPSAHAIETIAGRWVLDVLDLPRDAITNFGTTSGASAISYLAAARGRLLGRAGWNVERDGMNGAPRLRVILSERIHVTVIKALRLLGFGQDQLVRAPVDSSGRVDPARLPTMDHRTILCLQAGEVNTGEFDPFDRLVPRAKAAGAWVHVDGAFGLWARATQARKHLTKGIEGADSWTVDGHKWLNTPYDGAIAICRDSEALYAAMNADASYAPSNIDAPANKGLEFSRRARGIPIWAALRTLGRNGIDDMMSRHCDLARQLASELRANDFEILNSVQLNQVLARLDSDDKTRVLIEAAVGTGKVWFGPSSWEGRAAFRISITNWQTREEHIRELVGVLKAAKARVDDEVTVSR